MGDPSLSICMPTRNFGKFDLPPVNWASCIESPEVVVHYPLFVAASRDR